MRPTRLLVPLAGLVVAIGCGAVACRRSSTPPSFPGAPIVLVSIDTLRSDRLPAYGYEKVETPYLDRFRQDSILFESAWSPCPMTLPAHVTLLTGLLPPLHGVRNNVGFRFDGKRHPHLPGLLKARGYATGGAVSSYVLRGETGLGALFDEYEDSLDPRSGTGFADQQRRGTDTLRFARAWISAHHAAPFFYFFHIYEPHVPWEPPEPFRSRYGATYDAEVAAADAVVGQLLDALRAEGLYDRAIVVVTSDHGEGLSDHGEEQHSILLYREALQVPLLVKLPGQLRHGETVREPVGLGDVAGTLAALVGAPPLAGSDGRSILGPLPAARPLYAETLYPRLHLGWSELRSIVDGRWHYIHGPQPELYDLAADGPETRNLAAREAATRERLLAELARVPEGESAPGAVDAEAAARMAALGYVGTVRDRGRGPLPNPRDQLPQLARMREGFHEANERRYEQAADTLGSVVREQPANVEAWVRLGESLLELGRAEEAAHAFEQALQRSGLELPDVVLQLGYAQLRARQLDEAEAAAARVETAAPAQARELKARVALARGRTALAQSLADAAVVVRNPQPASYLVGAEVRAARGDFAGALERVALAQQRAQAIGLDAVSNLEALRGDALARLGRFQEAEAAYRLEATRFPGNVVAQARLAALLLAAGRRADADAVLEAMLAANPHARAREAARVVRGLPGAVTFARPGSRSLGDASSRGSRPPAP